MTIKKPAHFRGFGKWPKPLPPSLSRLMQPEYRSSKYLQELVQPFSLGLIYVNDLYPHTFQIENYRDIIQTTKDKEARMRGGAREGAGRRSEGRKYYKIRLSESEYRMIALMGGSKWIQDHIKSIGEKAMTTAIDTTKFTDEEQSQFIEGWKAAGGYIGDLEAGVDCPWCMPWFSGNGLIEVTGTEIRDWGRQYWEACKDEIEALLKEESEQA